MCVHNTLRVHTLLGVPRSVVRNVVVVVTSAWSPLFLFSDTTFLFPSIDVSPFPFPFPLTLLFLLPTSSSSAYLFSQVEADLLLLQHLLLLTLAEKQQ